MEFFFSKIEQFETHMTPLEIQRSQRTFLKNKSGDTIFSDINTYTDTLKKWEG